ncbi:MAG: primosomal protein N' [Puniceicoccales bacterium]|jgi:primosomal protein N' (replication factor Y)|nr:primosomal protein N' [Puniceicoccales bacterium]
MECLCAEVLTFGTFDEPLLYTIPRGLENVLTNGMLVRVPFGRTKTLGIIINICYIDPSMSSFQVKEILNIEHDIPLLGSDLIKLIFWMHKYYAVSYRSLLETVIPLAIRKNTKFKLVTKLSLIKILSDEDRKTLEVRSPKQYLLYEFLLKSNRTFGKAELKNFSVAAINSLIDKGIVGELFERADCIVYDDPIPSESENNGKNVILTTEQQDAAAGIAKSLVKGEFCTHLIHGITGSGKTEVYLHAIKNVLEMGGDIVYLVPELTLTPQTVRRIRHGIDLPAAQVVVWHSGLSEGERRNAWLAMANGEAKIVIGARSAVFAPLKNTKIIIVDEEHETTYKQAETPRYHARDVAVYRAKLCNAICVLGSATPSIESLFNASLRKYKLNVLKNRIDGSTLPTIEVVNMRYEYSSGSKNIISSRLHELIENRLENHEQIILFLNKRGYASVVFCKNCNYVATCPHCSTSMTYHKQQNTLRCHICNYIENLPTKCPKCGGYDIFQSGIGTQKLISVVTSLFPLAKVERLDSDTTMTKDSFYNILNRFRDGKIDILVGTQMISKGLDFPNVSLVGIIDIDNAMNFPDFRSNERIFQSIIQVSGRAGRGNKPGIVIIQTHFPSSDLIKLAVQNDIEAFLKNELVSRSEFFYPPFSHIIRLIFSGKNEVKTEFLAKNFCDDLRKQSQGLFELRGLAPAVIFKVKDRFRFSLMCFSKNTAIVLEKIHKSKEVLKKAKDITLTIDVDPIDMM